MPSICRYVSEYTLVEHHTTFGPQTLVPPASQSDREETGNSITNRPPRLGKTCFLNLGIPVDFSALASSLRVQGSFTPPPLRLLAVLNFNAAQRASALRRCMELTDTEDIACCMETRGSLRRGCQARYTQTASRVSGLFL
jgi:hypothetical protein